MNNLNLFKSKSLLLCGIILGGVMLPALSANGQCVAKHYLKRHGSSAYQAAGLNPYTGRYVFSVYFTPLQNQLYSDVVPGCVGCAAAVSPNVDSGQVIDSDAADNNVGAPVDEVLNDPKPSAATPVNATVQATTVNWARRKQKLID